MNNMRNAFNEKSNLGLAMSKREIRCAQIKTFVGKTPDELDECTNQWIQEMSLRKTRGECTFSTLDIQTNSMVDGFMCTVTYMVNMEER